MTDATSMFVPLSVTARPNGSLTRPNQPAWEWVSLVPNDAPQPPSVSGTHRWWYRNADGSKSFAVDRHEADNPNGRKRFFPCALWRDDTGQLIWQRKHPPFPRPLYGIDQLSQRTNAPVLVVEGEKTAEAAKKRFPNFVVVTSSGGSKAADKSDWQTVYARDVVVWPDNDEPGRRYAETVARLAGKAGAKSVRLVAVPSDWPVSWDLADEPPDKVTATMLQRMADDAHGFAVFEGSAGSGGSKSGKQLTSDENLESQIEGAPGFREGSVGSDWLPDGFRLRPDGAIERKCEKGWKFLCSPLEVVAATRAEDGVDWGRLVRVCDRDGHWHDWAMPMSELAGSGESYRARLFGMGLEMAPGTNARSALQTLLTTANPSARVRSVSRLGWHGDVFVLPDESIGEKNGECFAFQSGSQANHSFNCNGTLEGWRDAIAKPSEGNSRLVFSISMAFAAPLLRRLGIEGGGIHWRGPSSTGKTTMGIVAGSVCGGGRDGYQVSWRATDNGIEGTAASHNDNLLALDEIGEVGPEAAGAVAYMLANGQAKQRMNRNGDRRPAIIWKTLFLSTGEIGLADKLREGKRGGRVMAGQAVRVLDLHADAGCSHGVFDHLSGHDNGQALADHLKAAAGAHYGHPLRAFLRALIAEWPFEKARAIINAFVNDVVPKGADGQVRRAAYRFGVIAAGGELACGYGILPWPPGEAIAAAKRLFEDWLEGRGGAGPSEIASGISTVRQFLDAHGTSRFLPKTDVGRVVPNRVGYSDTNENGTTYFITPDAWRNEILPGHDAGLIAKEMARRGMIKTNADGKPQTKQRMPDGQERRVIVVLPALFADDEVQT